jgi:hypothetical protein
MMLRVIAVSLVLCGLVVCACPSSSEAAKWRHCPSQLVYVPSTLGAVAAPFVHPGHELGIFLMPQEVESTGGFSTAPDGNVVSVTFVSLFGAPITLPPITVAAVSPSTLYFTFPDTKAERGNPLAGPVHVVVTTGAQTTAEINPRHLVGLPPSTDVGKLIAGDTQQGALATMDTRGALWIPVQFSAYGPMQKPMPMCPGTFIPVTAFNIGVTVRAIPSGMPDAEPSYPPFRALRRVDLFLGDFLVDGTNFYGMRVGRLPVFRVPRGFGMKVCGVNDAVDLVMRAPGRQRWARPWSVFGTWMPSSKPLEIVLSETDQASALDAKGLDTFGAECVLR